MKKRERIEVERKQEMRTKDISKMIGEGGLGADNYYKIVKDSPSKKDEKRDEDVKENDEK